MKPGFRSQACFYLPACRVQCLRRNHSWLLPLSLQLLAVDANPDLPTNTYLSSASPLPPVPFELSPTLILMLSMRSARVSDLV